MVEAKEISGRDRKFLCHDIIYLSLCRDRVFHVATEFGQDQRALCHDTTFCVMTELVKARSSMPRQSISVSRRSWLGQEFFFISTEYFYVVTKYGQMERFIVATEKFYVATQLARLGRFSIAIEDFSVATELA